jgi:hypothetical protein
VPLWCGDGEQIQQRQQPQEINVNGEVGRPLGARKKERKKERREKLEAENWFESQQSQWPSQAELNSSDGSEHDEGGSVDKH